MWRCGIHVRLCKCVMGIEPMVCCRVLLVIVRQCGGGVSWCMRGASSEHRERSAGYLHYNCYCARERESVHDKWELRIPATMKNELGRDEMGREASMAASCVPRCRIMAHAAVSATPAIFLLHHHILLSHSCWLCHPCWLSLRQRRQRWQRWQRRRRWRWQRRRQQQQWA